MQLIESYKDAKEFLFNQLPMFQRAGPKAFKKDLKNIKKLMSLLDHPEQGFKSVHIAGTNGKGSTAHFIAAILQAHGLKVGIYSSPHYKDYRERIKINGKKIEKKAVIAFINRLFKFEVFKSKLKPSFFEITVAMAFDYFSKSDIDVAIIETGLGGRLDSTNVLHPLISVITNIGFDHVNFLGNTLPLIAAEKAGIIKQEVPVIIGQSQVETNQVFSKKASKMKASLVFSEDVLKVQLLQSRLGKTTFGVSLGENTFKLKTQIAGAYQQHNIRTAICTCLMLSKYLKNLKITDENIKLGLEKTIDSIGYMGRFQTLNTEPLAIADSAHNRDGLKILFKEIKDQKFKKLHIVYGAVNDKDLADVFNILPKDARYYFCKADIPRGMKAEKLKDLAKKNNLVGQAFPSVKKAYESALKDASKQDLVLITGSIFIVAELM